MSTTQPSGQRDNSGNRENEAFSEAAYDSALETMWLTFRAELADRLADLSVGHPLEVTALWTEMFGPQPSISFCRNDSGRLQLSLRAVDLYPYPPEQQARLTLIHDLGWQPDDGWELADTEYCLSDFPEREVDAAALLAERTLREVWDVLDPSFLISEENEVIRRFTDPPPQPREPKMR